MLTKPGGSSTHIRFYCPRWGAETQPWPEFCRRVKDSGYDGVETSLPLGDRPLTDLILASLAESSLELVAQHWETIDTDFSRHMAEYRSRLEWLAGARPRFINSQTGRDWFSFKQNRKLIAMARSIAIQTGIDIRHETHRGKFSYAAAVTARFLAADPELRISADFSHWCVVSESLLADQSASLDLAISRADHIHARIGYPEGPQISDPRAPEWREAMDSHLAWWDRIVASHRAAGSAVLSVTPEFGPAPYMPCLPFTVQPVTDQWAVNCHMMETLRERWTYKALQSG